MNRPLAEYTWEELLDEMYLRVREGGTLYIKGESAENKNTITYEKINPDREDQGESVLGFTNGKEDE